MKSLRKKGLLVAVGLAALALAAGCDGTVVTMYSYAGPYTVSGKAIDIGSANAALPAGTSIKLTNYYDTSQTYGSTVNAYGVFSIDNVPGGRYNLTGIKDGYFIIPTQLTVGQGAPAPYVLGASTASAKTIVAMVWDDADSNIDLLMTWGSETANTYNVMGNSSDTASGAGWNASRVVRSADRVESIQLSVNSANETFRYFIRNNDPNGYTTGNSTLNAKPAGVVVYTATIKTGANSEFLGTYFAPYDTADKYLRICRIAANGSLASIYADEQQDTTYRSLSGLPRIGIPVETLH